MTAQEFYESRKTTLVNVPRVGMLAILFLIGCSSHHAYIPPDQAHYGPPQWQCDINNNCDLVQRSEPAQLTPVGCFLNQWTLGLGHRAEECIKPKKAKVKSSDCFEPANAPTTWWQSVPNRPPRRPSEYCKEPKK